MHLIYGLLPNNTQHFRTVKMIQQNHLIPPLSLSLYPSLSLLTLKFGQDYLKECVSCVLYLSRSVGENGCLIVLLTNNNIPLEALLTKTNLTRCQQGIYTSTIDDYTKPTDFGLNYNLKQIY